MVRPEGRSPFPPTNSMAQDFVPLSASRRQLSALQSQSSTQRLSSLDTSFASTHIPSQISSELKARHQSSQQSLLDNAEPPSGRDHNLQRHTSELLRLHQSLAPFTNVRYDPRASSYEPPWNPVNVSMLSPSDQTLTELTVQKRPYTDDSGYASSQKSRRVVTSNLQQVQSLERGHHYLYDEPIGSAAQQIHFLPDQQHRQTIVTPSSPRPPSIVATEPKVPLRCPQSLECEECKDIFNTKSELAKHMARHNRKFTCDYSNCPRRTEGFATKNDLDRHKASVHHDSSVSRREFKCCVPNCKDPNKLWDRKDNFKAHVKRMHPDANIDDVINRSFQGESTPGSIGDNGIFPNLMNFPVVNPMTNMPNPQTPTSVSHYNTTYYSPNQNMPEDDDLYGPSPGPGPRQALFPQYEHSRYPGAIPMQSQDLPITGPANYAEPSNTLGPQTSTQDNSRPVFAHRSDAFPFTYGETPMVPNNMRAYDVRTAPLPGHSNELLGWSQQGEAATGQEAGIHSIDPSMQTLQSGSLFQSNMMPELTDSQAPSNINLTADEQSMTNPAVEERRREVWDQLEKILKPLSPEQLKLMVDTYRSHPPVNNKASYAVQQAINSIQTGPRQGYPCSREGCTKTFTQKNVRTKHEKRHDRAFFCTFDHCYSAFGSKDDLKRHERRKHEREAFYGWRCFFEDVPTSQHRLECYKFFENEEEFKQHRREEHRERAGANNVGLKALKLCYLRQGAAGQFWCGFCNKVIRNDAAGVDGTRRDKLRFDHIDNHVTKENLKMSHWTDLKAGGLSKTEVKAQDLPQTILEDSQEDDDMDEGSPEASHTLGNTGSHVPTPSSRHLAVPPNDGRNKKRAMSDADANPPVHASKVPRLMYQQPRQGSSMSRTASSMTPTRQNHVLPTVRHQHAPQIALVYCCQCGIQGPLGTSLNCTSPNCFHAICSNCTCWTPSGQQLILRSNPSTGQGSS